MKIPINYDVEGKAAPSYNKGTSPLENPQIAPHESAIPESADMKASNSTEPETVNKGQPFKTKGGGYCS